MFASHVQEIKTFNNQCRYLYRENEDWSLSLNRGKRKVAREWENNQGALRLLKIKDTIVGRATNVHEHQEAI